MDDPFFAVATRHSDTRYRTLNRNYLGPIHQHCYYHDECWGAYSEQGWITLAIALDKGTHSGWLGSLRLPRMFRMMVDHIDEAANEFTWKKGKSLISLTRAGDSWNVQYQTASRLLGPRQCQYSATHRQAKFAAWDVMARVINACHDEDEGLEVALRAAQWMRRAESPAKSGA